MSNKIKFHKKNMDNFFFVNYHKVIQAACDGHVPRSKLNFSTKKMRVISFFFRIICTVVRQCCIVVLFRLKVNRQRDIFI